MERDGQNLKLRWARCEPLNQMGKAIGFDVVNYGFRLVLPNTDTNGTEWFDLRIEPKVISSANQYQVELIWRSSDLGKTIKRFRGVDDIVYNVINKVEKE